MREVVPFTYPADHGLCISPVPVDAGTEGLEPLTDWYQLSSTGGQEVRVMVFPQQKRQGLHMKMQVHNPETGSTSLSSTGIASYAGATNGSPLLTE